MKRCAVIGVGGIARLYAQALKLVPGARLVAGCCRGEAKGRKFAAEFACTWYADYEEMLEKERPDFAIITTPSGAHLAPSLACFRRGVHVLCDKPLEITPGRCDEMIAAAEAAGVQLGCIFQTRMLDSFTALREAAAAGRFGSVATLGGIVPWWRDDAYYAPERWQGTAELDGGGAAMNQGIHTIDALLYVAEALLPGLPPGANPVEEVSAWTAKRAHAESLIEVEDLAAINLRFRGGAVGQVLCATSMYPGAPRRVWVSGRDGTAEVSGDVVSRWDFRTARAGDAAVVGAGSTPGGVNAASDPLALPTEPARRVIAAFVASLSGGPAFGIGGRAARKAVDVICAAYDSARRGGAPVRVAGGGASAGGAAAISPGSGAVIGPGAYHIGAEELAAASAVVRSGSLSRDYGPDNQRAVLRFEEAFAAHSRTRFALGTTSGTAAIKISLAALGVGPGDEVIVPCLTWISTAAAVVLLGAVPVFAEVDASMTMDPDDVEGKITPRTRAIIPVHLYGVPCDMDRIGAIAAKRGVRIVEDCAQAIGVTYRGRPVGSLGALGAFSLQFTKSITCGDGGVVTSSDDALYERAVRYHDVGKFRTATRFPGVKTASDGWTMIGENLRMTEVHAAIVDAQLEKVPRMIAATRRDYARFATAFRALRLRGVALTPVNDEEGHLGHNICVVCDTAQGADALKRGLEEAGEKPFRLYEGRMMYQDDPWRSMATHAPHANPWAMPQYNDGRAKVGQVLRDGLCPRSEGLAARTLTLLRNDPPHHPERIDRLVAAVRAAAAKAGMAPPAGAARL